MHHQHFLNMMKHHFLNLCASMFHFHLCIFYVHSLDVFEKKNTMKDSVPKKTHFEFGSVVSD